MKQEKLTGHAIVTVSIKADFFDDDNLDARDGVQHSIRFTIDDPGLSMKNGRKQTWGPGFDLGFQLGKLSLALKDYICDFDGSDGVTTGFANGSGDCLDEPDGEAEDD